MAVMLTEGVVKIWDRANDTQVGDDINATDSTVLFLNDQRLVYKSTLDKLNVLNVSTRANDVNLNDNLTMYADLGGGLLAGASALNTLYFYNLKTPARYYSLLTISSPTVIMRSTSMSSYFVYGDLIGGISVTRSDPVLGLWYRSVHSKKVTTLDDFEDGYLLSGSLDGTVKMSNLINGSLISSFSLFQNEIYSIKVFSNGSFAVAGFKKQVYLVQIDKNCSMNIATLIELPNDAIYPTDLRVSKDGILIMSFYSGSIGYYNLTSLLYIKTVSISQLNGIHSIAILGT